MARSLGASKLLVFGPFGIRIPAKFTAEALLEPLFRQFPNGVLRSSHLALVGGIILSRGCQPYLV
jgi:hypothetical protein